MRRLLVHMRSLEPHLVRGSAPDQREVSMTREIKKTMVLACGAILLGLALTASAQNAQQPSSARQELQGIHGPQSLDQQLARLTRDLELTPDQQKQVRALLQEHHDKIQALLDKNPTSSRQSLGPQIHAISDETHHQIHALLDDHQKDLETEMQQRERNGEESRRPASQDAN